MKKLGSHVGVLACLLALAVGGCAGTLPETGRLPTQRNTQNATVERFKQDEGDVAVLHQRTAGSSPLGETKLNQELSPQLARRPISIDFQNPDANLGDLVGALSAYDIPIAFRWSQAARGGSGGNGATASGTSTRSGSTGNDLSPRKDVVVQKAASGGGGDEALQRRLPFTSYKGTVGGLFKTLRTGLALSSWEEDGMVYVADTDTYAVTMPQDKDAIKAMTDTLKSLGAEEITDSVDGGRIVYSASPAQHDHVIGPFVRRVARNLATIAIQVSIVNLALTDKSGQGFDWSKFSLAADQRANSVAAANAAGTTATTASTASSGTSVTTSGLSSGLSSSTVGTADTTGTAAAAQKGVLSSLSSTGLTLGTTSVGKVFGVQTVASVSSAIQFLSIFGNTNITQQVSVRTLSGKEVKFSSGEEIPYVTGVGVGTVGSAGTTSSNSIASSSGYSSNSTLGTSSTDKVKIGTDITMTPRFESENELVTIDFKMKLSSLIEFVKLDAGSQLGTLTQPHTAEQELNSMLRVKAGQTVVLGGLQKDSEQYDGSEPTALRDQLRDDQVALGSRAQDVSRNALFVILRPTVTVYEPEEGR